MFNAKLAEDILNQEEVEYILNTVKTIEPWERGGSDFWDNRSLNAISLYNSGYKELGELLYDIRSRVGEAIMKFYNEPEIYPDLCQVVRWFPGQEQPPHADDMTDAQGTEWFHHRHYGAIIYLNDDYIGGQTYYPQHNVGITPKSGMLAVHPGDINHYHGVTKVENSMRYTIASFWTRDKNYFDGWTLP